MASSHLSPVAWKLILLIATVLVICFSFNLIQSTPLAQILPYSDTKHNAPNMQKGTHAHFVMHPLVNSSIHAQQSYGCAHTNSVPGLSFTCHPAIEVDSLMSRKERREAFYNHILRRHVSCNQSQMIGRDFDGGWRVCTVGTYKWKEDNCLVYSFGINNDWSFDEASFNNYGCKVNSFDPTIGLEDHLHSEGIMFYNTGLGGENEVNKQGWKIRTLCSLVKEHHHASAIIDYVKFDIEFSEWPALIAMIKEGCLSNIKQIAFEIHAWEDTAEYYMIYWQAMQGLENAGFQRWYLNNRNWNCFKPKDNPSKRYCPQSDMGYINTRFLDSPEKTS